MSTDPQLTLTSTYHPCNQVVGVLRGHVSAALTLLSAQKKPSASRIHAARQELKRARATLRLLQRTVDREQFRQEDATLRQAARQLNSARDSDVLWRVFSRLQELVKDESSQTNLEPLSRLLLQERRSATTKALTTPLTNASTLLLQVRERTGDWLVSNDMDLVTRAVQRTYRKGHSCFHVARESQADEDLHAWRRQVKYLGYQLEALGPLAPARMTKRLRKCAKLAKALGRDHDLSLLQKRIGDVDLDAASSMRLRDTIVRERTKLQRQATDLGERLYSVKPRQFQPLN